MLNNSFEYVSSKAFKQIISIVNNGFECVTTSKKAQSTDRCSRSKKEWSDTGHAKSDGNINISQV
jgi:hypothetical protein